MDNTLDFKFFPSKIQNQSQLLICRLQIGKHLISVNWDNFGAGFDFENDLTI